jgi:hypothetical protein
LLVGQWPVSNQKGSGLFLRADDVFLGGNKDAFVVLDTEGQVKAYDTRLEVGHGVCLDTMVSKPLAALRELVTPE